MKSGKQAVLEVNVKGLCQDTISTSGFFMNQFFPSP
jgi:hypothetical protein